jgi:hypothetical protein
MTSEREADTYNVPVEEIQELLIFATMCADGQPEWLWTDKRLNQMKRVNAWLQQVMKARGEWPEPPRWEEGRERAHGARRCKPSRPDCS